MEKQYRILSAEGVPHYQHGYGKETFKKHIITGAKSMLSVHIDIEHTCGHPTPSPQLIAHSETPNPILRNPIACTTLLIQTFFYVIQKFPPLSLCLHYLPRRLSIQSAMLFFYIFALWITHLLLLLHLLIYLFHYKDPICTNSMSFPISQFSSPTSKFRSLHCSLYHSFVIDCLNHWQEVHYTGFSTSLWVASLYV